jgi:hypothetical protein
MTRGRSRNEQPDLIARLVTMEERIKNLEKVQRIGNTSVDTGKIVINNGAIVVQHANGAELFRTGREGIGASFVDNVYVTRVRRNDDTEAIVVYDDDTNLEIPGALLMYDRVGNIIFSENYTTGNGLGRPFLISSFAPTSEHDTPSVLTTSGTFEPLWTITGEIQHSNIRLSVLVKADAGTTGEIRLVDPVEFALTGAEIIPVEAIADGEFAYRFMIGNFSGNFGESYQYDLEVRRVSGAGNVRVLLVYTMGYMA